jgi:ATP-dependent phosphoenolpyruvate carboxykinase
VAQLYEYAMLPEHQRSPDPTVKGNTITETGALCISSGDKTGRVPKEKRIVLDDMTRDVSSSSQSASHQLVKASQPVEALIGNKS